MKRPVRLGANWQRTTKWLASAAWVSAALALAPAGTAAVNATVTGSLIHCLGPATQRSCIDQERAMVSAFNAHHRLVAKEWVTNGHFSFLLQPGRYTLLAKARCVGHGKRAVTARSHRTVHRTIVFNG